ncbi:MAG: hypothetical protein QGG42_03320 [Phycisphaerae bacterium]|jgi:hypothetical protein|nr:hypothetical protein [Phycisphaerae bacterium]
MADQTVASLFTQSIPREEILVSAVDRDVLRSLAGELAELANRDIEQDKADLWRRHNALEPTRPVVFCDPENGWNEIITPDQIQCEGSLARSWETHLRKEIYWADSMGDDKVVDPVLRVRHVYTESDWGMHERVSRSEAQGSYRWEAPLVNYDLLDRLHFPTIDVDREATEQLMLLAGETFADLLTVELNTQWWWTLGMTWTLINLRGFTQFMLDMYDHPAGLHRLMEILRDGHVSKLDFLEDNDLLSLNNDNTYVGSGGFGFTDELPQTDFTGRVRTTDMWGFCESQETVGVSPDMFEEFVFPYQLPILERFGLNCYGCCEPLDKRWHVVKRIPRLRRVSVSPWADVEAMAENLGGDYIYSFKPSPADLARPNIDADRIRAELRRAMDITRGCRLEVIMKDNHTLANTPSNAARWCQIAREEAEKT